MLFNHCAFFKNALLETFHVCVHLNVKTEKTFQCKYIVEYGNFLKMMYIFCSKKWLCTKCYQYVFLCSAFIFRGVNKSVGYSYSFAFL